jgi:hypothetical protein
VIANALLKELGVFVADVERSIADTRSRWRTLETIDVSQYMLAVLPLRNFDVFEAYRLVADRLSVAVAEMLLRPLFEGTVILEWCNLDLLARALRFRRTSFESTLELVDLGFIRRRDDYVANLRDSVAWLEAQGHKRLPNIRQLVNDLDVFRPVVGYPTYKLLSKLVHTVMESWKDYADSHGRASSGDFDWSPTPRYFQAPHLRRSLPCEASSCSPRSCRPLTPVLARRWNAIGLPYGMPSSAKTSH